MKYGGISFILASSLCSWVLTQPLSPPDPINMFNKMSVLIGVKRMYALLQQMREAQEQLSSTSSKRTQERAQANIAALKNQFDQINARIILGNIETSANPRIKLFRLIRSMRTYFHDLDTYAQRKAALNAARTSAERERLQEDLDLLTKNIQLAEYQMRLTRIPTIDWNQPLPPAEDLQKAEVALREQEFEQFNRNQLWAMEGYPALNFLSNEYAALRDHLYALQNSRSALEGARTLLTNLVRSLRTYENLAPSRITLEATNKSNEPLERSLALDDQRTNTSVRQIKKALVQARSNFAKNIFDIWNSNSICMNEPISGLGRTGRLATQLDDYMRTMARKEEEMLTSLNALTKSLGELGSIIAPAQRAHVVHTFPNLEALFGAEEAFLQEHRRRWNDLASLLKANIRERKKFKPNRDQPLAQEVSL